MSSQNHGDVTNIYLLSVAVKTRQKACRFPTKTVCKKHSDHLFFNKAEASKKLLIQDQYPSTVGERKIKLLFCDLAHSVQFNNRQSFLSMRRTFQQFGRFCDKVLVFVYS